MIEANKSSNWGFYVCLILYLIGFFVGPVWQVQATLAHWHNSVANYVGIGIAIVMLFLIILGVYSTVITSLPGLGLDLDGLENEKGE